MKIVSFEGVDGSGKTTLALLVKEKLENLGYKVKYYKEDTVDNFALQIRKLMKETKISSPSKTFLFFSLRANFLSNHLSKLRDVDFVLLDRFVDSTLVYDCLIDGVPMEIVNSVNDYLLKEYKLKLDLTVIVDCSSETISKRLESREDSYLYDYTEVERIDRIRKLFLTLPEINRGRKYIVLGNESIEDLQLNVSLLLQILQGKKQL